MILISETNLSHDALLLFEHSTTVADPSKKICTYSGIAWYVRKSLVKNMFQVQFNESYIPFPLKLVPNMIFIWVYVQPDGTHDFNVHMVAEIGALLADSNQKGFVPSVGWDSNSLPGDLHLTNTDTWTYKANIDSKRNKHCETLFCDLFCAGNILPSNGIKYYGKTFDNNFHLCQKYW